MKIIISDDELRKVIKLPLPELVNGELKLPEVVKQKELGRPEGAKNLDPLTKELVALDGARGFATQTEIARVHDVDQAQVSYLSRGFDRSSVDERKLDPDLHTRINQTKFNIIDTATSKLMETLDLFEPSHIEQKQLPEVANKMATVIERLEGRGNVTNAPSVSFHVYAPRTRHEDQYEVITVNE